MKFLVTATPIVPLTDQAVLDKLADWMREQQQAGRIMAAYGLVGGGGATRPAGCRPGSPPPPAG
jgi:hypothetical protein